LAAGTFRVVRGAFEGDVDAVGLAEPPSAPGVAASVEKVGLEFIDAVSRCRVG
jgi:hypothetical protein